VALLTFRVSEILTLTVPFFVHHDGRNFSWRWFRLENVDREILEEVVLPGNERVLAGKRYTATAAGAVSKEIRVPFCDWCGRRLGEKDRTIICCVCRRKLCESPSCAIALEGRNYCPEHAQQSLPISRLQWKIIHGLINVLSLDEIKDLTHTKRDDLVPALAQLKIIGYIEKKGISLFSHYEVLDRGVLAWRTYHKAFTDSDIAYFVSEVGSYLREVSGRGAKKCGGERR